MFKTEKTVFILDTDKLISEDGIKYRWDGYEDDNYSISLLLILEKNVDELRQSFLKIQRSFISNLSKNILLFSSNNDIEITLLWSSLLVEKNIIKTPSFLTSLRLLCIEKELKNIECTRLRYIGPQQPVAEALERLCEYRNIKFFWDQTSSPNTDSFLRRVWKRSPSFIRSVVSLFRYAWNYWSLRKADKPSWHDSTDTIFLFSYFIHLDRKSSEKGKFYSKQWEALPEVLEQSGKSLNWMHIFLYSPLVPNTATGVRWLNNFNRNKHQKSAHTFLSSYLGWDVLLRSLQDYCKCYFHYFLSNQKIDQTLLSQSDGWLWPVLRRDWHNSIFDTTAIQNILQMHLFDKAMSSLPRQHLGLYLYENQGWERIFIKAWRKYGHGRLIGVAHSTISHWDMRYFNQTDELIDIPVPDTVAVNGPNAWKTLKAAGQDMNQYVKVEALRYQYLNTFHNAETLGEIVQSLRFLIIGDIRPETTHRMLLVIEKAFKDIKDIYQIQIKPHPGNPVYLYNYPLLRAEIVAEDLSELLPRTDLVLTSVFTSAGLDAFCTGTRVISYLDPYDLNYSILRGVDGVEFISSSRDLLQVLKQNKCISNNLSKPENFFWLNPELHLWKALLGLDQKYIAEKITKSFK